MSTNSIEPRKFGTAPSNPYAKRWNWWYSAIADWMIRNPDKHLKDCAAELNRGVNTISMIVNTDMFREYLARRKQEWREHHDFAIVSKVTQVAELGLDVLLEKLEKKKDQIPTQLVTELTTSALDRLGYGPKQQSPVQVNVQQNDNRTMVAVDASALSEAREAMRLAERRNALESRSEAPAHQHFAAPQIEAEANEVSEVSQEGADGNPVAEPAE